MKTVENIHVVLEKYWGFNAFRPLQEDIIESVLNGNDTLALLPTGGGKSICFQVPALASEGLCIVITPLIALMKDQVYNLNKREIKAAAIYSGLSQREILLTLENAVNGKYSFLYVSPERLLTPSFSERVIHMPVNLIAVDEAHCISQWGYDFRPAYLQISEIRKQLPDTTILALTASATPDVQSDISKKLFFKPGWKKFEKSFVRENLSYLNIYEENKQDRLVRIINKVGGTGIVYVRNRRKTMEWAAFLRKNDISADYYHAGLDNDIRNRKQDEWIGNKTRIMVCTNAFGMGIDKPDVRLVVHLDICESLEAYYQEAGRAGRDGNESYCVVLYDQPDIIQTTRSIEDAFPSKKEVTKVYHELFNFLQIAYGDGNESTYSLNLIGFNNRLGLSVQKMMMAFRLLEQMGYLSFSESVFVPSKVQFKTNTGVLEHFQKEYPTLEPMIKIFLRSFPGIFDYHVSFREAELANNLGITTEDFWSKMDLLKKYRILDFEKAGDGPRVTFLTPRLRENAFQLDNELYQKRKDHFLYRRKKMLEYILEKESCRSKMISEYFGEKNASACGKCDVCRSVKLTDVDDKDFQNISTKITNFLSGKAMSPEGLLKQPFGCPENKVKKVIRFLVDNGYLQFKNNLLSIK